MAARYQAQAFFGGTSSTALDFQFSAETGRLAADLKRLGDGRDLKRALRRNLRRTAEPIKRRTQANASWSRRIPGAVKVVTSLSARNPAVAIRVDSNRAPHARPLEQGSKGRRNVNRHPLFGNREVWIDQPTRPFFFRATTGAMPAVERAAIDAVHEAARKAGFSGT